MFPLLLQEPTIRTKKPYLFLFSESHELCWSLRQEPIKNGSGVSADFIISLLSPAIEQLRI